MEKGLCELCNPKQWKTVSTSELTSTGYPVYGANGVIGYYSNYNHDKETLLITCRGATCGTLNICKPFSYINGNAMALDDLSDEIDIKYLYYFLLSRGLSDTITGSAQPQIVRQSLKNVRVIYPNLDAQKRIIYVLGKADELLSIRKQQIAKLDELIKARFVEMFGDFKSNSKGWSIVKFDEFAQIDGNMTTDYKKYADYPHIGIDSIEKGTGALKGYRTVKEDGVVSGKYIFTPQHIIYSKIRPNLNKVALPDFEGLCSADAYPILPNPKNCNRIFLALAMRSDYFLDYILQFSARTNLPKVNRKEIAGFSMPLPPLSLQNDFATFVERVDRQKQTVQQSLEKLELMKKALMQEYFG